GHGGRLDELGLILDLVEENSPAAWNSERPRRRSLEHAFGEVTLGTHYFLLRGKADDMAVLVAKSREQNETRLDGVIGQRTDARGIERQWFVSAVCRRNSVVGCHHVKRLGDFDRLVGRGSGRFFL